MPIVVKFPTPVEDERAVRFKVHHFYLAGIANYLSQTYDSSGPGQIRELIVEQRGLRSYRKISKRTSIDIEKLSQYLTLTWASELQLRLALLSEPSLLRCSNAWAPIHAYYAVYMSAQAWFISMGLEEIADNHTSSLNTLANQIKDRELFPLPWSVTCSGCPQIEPASFERIPSGIEPLASFQLLSRPTLEEFWPRYCKMLQTTRERRLERNFTEWKRQKHRKRMGGTDKLAVSGKLPATTMFDFFWRLRVRSNYRDVRAFIMSPVSSQWHEEFFHNLLSITDATCALLQSLVVAYVGKNAYKSAIDEFVEAQKVPIDEVTEPFSIRAQLLVE